MSNSSSNLGSQATQTVLVVLVSVLLTALLVLMIGGKGGRSQSSDVDSSSVVVSTAESDRDIAERIQRDSASLAERLELKERALVDAVKEKNSALSARDGMTSQLVDYKQQIQELLAKAGQQTNLLEQLNRAALDNERLASQNKTYLRDKIQLEEELGKLKTLNTQLQTEIASLRADLEEGAAKLADALANAKGDAVLEAQVIAFREENLELKKQMADMRVELNRAKLFVKEIDNLSPRAAALFNALAAIKDQQGETLDLAYSALQQELSVRKLRHVKFAKGSAFVPELEMEMIKKDLAEAAPNSFILVVGYASTTGSAAANYDLSAKRATSTASIVFSNKAEDQNVKAVFLGQTDRFDPNSPSANQVCEIWEVKKL